MHQARLFFENLQSEKYIYMCPVLFVNFVIHARQTSTDEAGDSDPPLIRLVKAEHDVSDDEVFVDSSCTTELLLFFLH